MNYEQFVHQHNGIEKNIFLVDMTKELDKYFGQLVKNGIGKYLRQGKKVGIIVNKKGYSNGLLCLDCGHVPGCKRCSVSIHYHKMPSGQEMGMCHICKSQYNQPQVCEECGSKNIKSFGIGTQKVEELIKQEFDVDTMIIESNVVNSPSKIKKVMEEIHAPHPKNLVIIGTSLLATPIAGYKFDLIVFINADLGLNIPDYNSSEKNFLLLYEAFTKYNTENFIVQSFKPEHYSIRSACKLDKKGFYEIDNEFRKEYNYPPFADLCVILYKNEIEETVFNKVDKLYKELLYLKERYSLPDLEIYNTPPLIYKIFGKYRYNIIIKGKDLRNFMDIVYTKLNLAGKGFKIDWKADSIV